MNNCGNCKYWARPYEGSREKWLVHKEGQELGECTLARGESLQNGAGALAVATCFWEGIYGELVTDSMFSCCQFKPKPAKQTT